MEQSLGDGAGSPELITQATSSCHMSWGGGDGGGRSTMVGSPGVEQPMNASVTWGSSESQMAS